MGQMYVICYSHIYLYPGIFGGINEVHGDVDGLHDDPERVDGDEQHLAGLDEGVVQPQHRTEQRH